MRYINWGMESCSGGSNDRTKNAHTSINVYQLDTKGLPRGTWQRGNVSQIVQHHRFHGSFASLTELQLGI